MSNTKKIILMITAGVIVGTLLGLWLTDNCKQPTDMQVYMTQLNCMQAIPVVEMRKAICLDIHGIEDCEFTEADLPRIAELFFKEVNECAVHNLKKNNLCVDKYEALK